jgi:hypothetical protein
MDLCTIWFVEGQEETSRVELTGCDLSAFFLRSESFSIDFL